MSDTGDRTQEVPVTDPSDQQGTDSGGQGESGERRGSFAERSRRRLGQTLAAAGGAATEAAQDVKSRADSRSGQNASAQGDTDLTDLGDGRTGASEHSSEPADQRSGRPTHFEAAGVSGQSVVTSEQTQAQATQPARSKGRRPVKPRSRRARLTAVRVDPWSVMKTAFMLSIAWGIMTFVAVVLVWNVLNASGVFESINGTVADVLGSASTNKFDIMQYVGLRRVMGITAALCVVDVVLIMALATLGAFLYNLSASLLGGVEVTLAEDD